MGNCPNIQDNIMRYLDDSLAPDEHQALREHLAQCSACAKAWAQMGLLEEIVKDAFHPETDVQEAVTQVTHRLAQQRCVPVQPVSGWIRRYASMAAILLIGVALGLMFQATLQQSTLFARRVPVAMQVAEVKGTVLVRHRDSQVWYLLKSDVSIYLGDTFYSTANSDFVLSLDHTNQIEVAQNSMLTLESADKKTQFYLEHGQCTPVLDGPHGPFFIRTPNGRMEALGTEFTVKVTE